jgi:hypothetical protein
MRRGTVTRWLAFGAVLALCATARLWAQATTATGQTQVPALGGVDINQLIQQIQQQGTTPTNQPTTPTTQTPTTTPGTTPGLPGTGTGGATRSPRLTGLRNTSLGSLQNRAPGRMAAQGIAVSTGSQQIPGDADQFVEVKWQRQALFNITQAVLQGIQQGIGQLFGRLFGGGLGLGGGLFGPGSGFGPPPSQIGDPLTNQTTTSTGDTIMLP